MSSSALALLAVSVLASGSSSSQASGSFAQRVFSPFWDTSDPSVPWQACPAKSLTLAFVLADKQGQPAWDGWEPIQSRAALVSSIRGAGKNVIVSFGGQSGKELALAHSDWNNLYKAYLSVVTKLDLGWVDLDVEGGAIADGPSVTRRNKALAKLQQTRPGLVVSYTLPVMPSGLDQSALGLLRDAKQQGVRVDVVNVMAMDYGESFKGDMGKYAIDAATNTYNQLQSIGLNSKVGICPMIGVNDVKAEVFTVANAQAVREFALAHDWVRWLAFWSINRDNKSASSSLNKSSGIRQKDWDFSTEFAKFG